VAADVRGAALHRRPGQPRADEKLIKKGVRLGTNYIIKQLYQQMFFFLVPLYGASATWSLSSWNWWMAPVLLVCAVVSTMDLVFDNVIMERRWLASAMYGLAMFGVLNVVLPLVFGVTHADGLSGRRRGDAAGGRAADLLGARGALRARRGGHRRRPARCSRRSPTAGARFPPAPLAMPETAVGHGTRGSYECLPPSKHVVRSTGSTGCAAARCWSSPVGSRRTSSTSGATATSRCASCRCGCRATATASVFVSELPPAALPPDPRGGVELHHRDARRPARRCDGDRGPSCDCSERSARAGPGADVGPRGRLGPAGALIAGARYSAAPCSIHCRMTM
jgi:hypothetical protein